MARLAAVFALALCGLAVAHGANFTLPTLPYKINALEPFMDAKTVRLHHDFHHQAFITNLNNGLVNRTDLADLGVLELCRQVGNPAGPVPATLTNLVRNNAGGAFNHFLFWRIMKSPTAPLPEGVVNEPSPALLTAINAAFGSREAMVATFNNNAQTRFGSGWSWLGVKADKTLALASTPNQDNPLQAFLYPNATFIPILGLDVWEHAYYLKYTYKRADYIAAFWNLVNWPRININYDLAVEGMLPPIQGKM